MKGRAALLVATLALPARPAWALCANCLGQSSRLGAALRLVGVFLLVPPAIFFAVAIAIRKLSPAVVLEKVDGETRVVRERSED
ncbi:MAG TPA: hypothetical protein VGP64_00505 [Polyangia bacterium]|jgi:hypothetical protein